MIMCENFNRIKSLSFLHFLKLLKKSNQRKAANLPLKISLPPQNRLPPSKILIFPTPPPVWQFSKITQALPPPPLTKFRGVDTMEWGWEVHQNVFALIIIDLEPAPKELFNFVRCNCKATSPNTCRNRFMLMSKKRFDMCSCVW